VPPFSLTEGGEEMFGKIKSWLASRDRAPVAPDGYRRFAFPGGTVDLPANWIMTERRGEGRWLVNSPDRQIQITVSATYYTPGSFEDDCRLFAAMTVERTQLESTIDAVVTRPDILVQDDDTLVAQYEGHQGQARRFTCKMIMRQGLIAIVYIEALAEDQPWLNDVSEVVFDSLVSHA
jgi:hypothetical protein